MLGKLVKAGAYVKAPKATFALLHPFKALKWGAVLWVGKKLYDSVRRTDRADREGTARA